MAYEESPFWPRYINEELRYAGFDNVVPVDEEGKDSIDTLLATWDSDPRKRISTAQRYESVPRSDGFQVLGLADSSYTDPYMQWRWDGTSISSDSSEDVSVGVKTFRSISMWVRINDTTYSSSIVSFNTPLVSSNVNSGGSGGTPVFQIQSEPIGGTDLQALAGFSSDYDVYENASLLSSGSAGTIETGNVVANNDWRLLVFNQIASNTNLYEIRDVTIGGPPTLIASPVTSVDIADIRFHSNTMTEAEITALYESPETVRSDTIWASSLPEFWCSYKAQLTDYFGDGTGDTSTVPVEFQEYAVHGAYADWLRMEGQNGKALAEEQFARESLERQLERIYYTSGSPVVSSNYNTHSKSQSR
jgi:hypothetical protein